MPAQEKDPKETAKALYSVLKELVALFKSGKIVTAAKFAAMQANPAVAIDASLLPQEQQEYIHIVLVLTKAEAALEALREAYDDNYRKGP